MDFRILILILFIIAAISIFAFSSLGSITNPSQCSGDGTYQPIKTESGQVSCSSDKDCSDYFTKLGAPQSYITDNMVGCMDNVCKGLVKCVSMQDSKASK